MILILIASVTLTAPLELGRSCSGSHWEHSLSIPSSLQVRFRELSGV